MCAVPVHSNHATLHRKQNATADFPLKCAGGRLCFLLPVAIDRHCAGAYSDAQHPHKHSVTTFTPSSEKGPHDNLKWLQEIEEKSTQTFQNYDELRRVPPQRLPPTSKMSDIRRFLGEVARLQRDKRVSKAMKSLPEKVARMPIDAIVRKRSQAVAPILLKSRRKSNRK